MLQTKHAEKRLLSTVSRTWPRVLLHLYHPTDVHISMAWCSMQSLTQPHQRGHLSSSARPLSATSFSGVSSSIDAHLPTAGCSAAGAFRAKRGSALRAVAKSRCSQQHVSYTQIQARLVAVWGQCRVLLPVTCDLLNVQHSCYSL